MKGGNRSEEKKVELKLVHGATKNKCCKNKPKFKPQIVKFLFDRGFAIDVTRE